MNTLGIRIVRHSSFNGLIYYKIYEKVTPTYWIHWQGIYDTRESAQAMVDSELSEKK